MTIPRHPNVPDLSPDQISKLTEIVFLPPNDLIKSDIVFVFGGRFPKLGETAFYLFNNSYSNLILISGGFTSNHNLPSYWKYGNVAESIGIKMQLIGLGVPDNCILTEDKSSNSFENVIFSKQIFDFDKLSSLIFVTKSFVAGRHFRTLKKHVSKKIRIQYFAYDTFSKDGNEISRNNWYQFDEGRSLVYGEYLRMLEYGAKGNLEPLDFTIDN